MTQPAYIALTVEEALERDRLLQAVEDAIGQAFVDELLGTQDRTDVRHSEAMRALLAFDAALRQKASRQQDAPTVFSDGEGAS